VKLVLFGHDHGNDFSGRWGGITMAYGRKSGQGGYSSSPLVPGARVIELTEGAHQQIDYRMWIRDRYGRRVEQEAPSAASRLLFEYPGTNPPTPAFCYSCA